MNKMKKTLYITGLLLIGSVFTAGLVSDSSFAASCNGVNTAIEFNCSGGSEPGGGFTSILLWVINIMAAGVGVAVVIGIVLGGITYSMSDGDASKAKQGKDMITNSIIGLFLFLFLFAAANFLVPGGLFNGSGSTPAPTSPTPSTPSGPMQKAV